LKTGVNFDIIDKKNGVPMEKHPQETRSSKLQDPVTRKYKVEEAKTRFTVVIDRIEHLPGTMAVTQLINPLQSGSGNDGFYSGQRFGENDMK
jgi:hypothetical protein